MSNKSTEQTQYNAEDLQRYHRGELDDDQMYELEKKALADPFLSDALDGFSQPTTYNRAEISKKIQKKFRRISFLTGNYTYLSIAASLLLILITTWELTKNHSTEVKSVVENNVDKEKNIPIPKDSVRIQLADNHLQVKLKEEKASHHQHIPKKNIEVKSAVIDLPKQESAQISMTEKKAQKSAEDPIQLKEYNAIAQNDVVSIAPQSAQKDEEAAVILNTTVSKKSTKLSSINSNDTNIAPETGWNSFNLYMHNGLKSVVVSQPEKQKGYCHVRFSLSKEKKPMKIIFPDSPAASDHLKTAIISLLEKGPAWTVTSGDKDEFEIRITLP